VHSTRPFEQHHFVEVPSPIGYGFEFALQVRLQTEQIEVSEVIFQTFRDPIELPFVKLFQRFRFIHGYFLEKVEEKV
jgi:hypothetical protein